VHSMDSSQHINHLAKSATLHCLTGCALGEVAGLVIGTVLGWGTGLTILLAVFLAFVFGFTLSAIPLLKTGMAFFAVMPIVFTADTLSIATMEIVDNAVMMVIPGAMSAGLVNPVFWVAMPVSLLAAFIAAYPVNKYLLKKNMGHAVLMKHHESHGHHG